MRLLDIARGQYVRSPAWVRRAVGPALSLLSPQLQYGGTYARWRADIARSRTDAAFVAETQLAALRGLYRASIEHSPFWRARFTAALGDLPTVDLFEPAHIARLPVLTREDIVEHGREMLAAPAAQLDAASTSGSSGRPVVFWLDKDRSPKELAFVNANWSQCGYREGDAKAVFRGLPFDRHAQGCYWEAGLRELRLSPWELTPARMDRYVELIEAHGVHYLYGYPSCLEIVGRHVERRGARLDIKGIFPISERLFPHQIAVFARAFPGARVVGHYGLSERVAFGSYVMDGETGDCGAYDLEPLYGYSELLDDHGRPVTTPGDRGRIVATGLLSTGMPLWRYETGDVARLVRLPGAESCHRMRVAEIEPRMASGVLIGKEGQRLDPHWFAQTEPSRFAAVREYQFYQDVPGKAVVRIVPMNGGDLRSVEPFLAGMRATVGSALELVPEIVAALEQNDRGKRKLAVQKLRIEH